MDGRLTRALVPLDAALTARLLAARDRLNLSGRGHDRVLRVARTIADLAGREQVAASDLDEALSYRLDARGADGRMTATASPPGLACADCLRRAFLIARLAPRIAGLLDRSGPRVRGVLALSEPELLSAVAGERAEQIALEFERFDADAAREQVAERGVLTLCRHSSGWPPRSCSSSPTRPP